MISVPKKKKIASHTKKQKNRDHSKQKKKSTETVPEKDPIVICKTNLLKNCLRDLRELIEDVKNVKKIMCEQNAKTNKERENLKRNQIEILELYSTVTEMKNSLEEFKDRSRKERIHELEYRTIEIIEYEEQKKRKVKEE